MQQKKAISLARVRYNAAARENAGNQDDCNATASSYFC
jgi:hypothetical protein